MSYIGNEPIVSATRTVTEITATAGQTVFTANGGYTVGFIDVFVNGSQLTASDFTATDGSTITLNEAASVNDIVRLVAWGTFTASNLVAPNYSGTLTGGTGVVNIGSGQLYKDASGNVGIGTSSPNTKLEVNQAITFTNIDTFGQLVVKAASGANGKLLNIGVDDTNNLSFIQSVNRGTDSNTLVLQRYGGSTQVNGNLLFNSGYGSAAIAYGCRAWVNFNGTGTVAIRASGNVSSITDNGAGDYRVNFSNALPDVNYCALISSQETAADDSNWARGGSIDVLNTGSVAVFTFDSRNPASPTDVEGVHVSVFR